MTIKWQFFVSQVIDNKPEVLEVYENVTEIHFVKIHIVHWLQRNFSPVWDQYSHSYWLIMLSLPVSCRTLWPSPLNLQHVSCIMWSTKQHFWMSYNYPFYFWGLHILTALATSTADVSHVTWVRGSKTASSTYLKSLILICPYTITSVGFAMINGS